jgi:hypothetical protein
LSFWGPKTLSKVIGDQANATKVIERNPMNGLRVYREMLKYCKEYGEKMTPGNTEFHQKKSLKKKKMHLQKRGMRLYKRCFNCIEKQHQSYQRRKYIIS